MGIEMEQSPMTSKIERTEPMRVSKWLVIRFLREHPHELAMIAPDWPGTVEEFCNQLEKVNGTYFVRGVLEA